MWILLCLTSDDVVIVAKYNDCRLAWAGWKHHTSPDQRNGDSIKLLEYGDLMGIDRRGADTRYKMIYTQV